MTKEEIYSLKEGDILFNKSYAVIACGFYYKITSIILKENNKRIFDLVPTLKGVSPNSMTYRVDEEDIINHFQEKDSFLKEIPTWVPSEEKNFKEITDKMLDTFRRKNHDYGNSFEELCNEEGIAAARIRLTDKYKRFKQLSKEEALVKDESIKDTLLDMANYCIMTLMWLDKNKGNENIK